jgi:uncharacterized protein (DUF1778 family)|tara:strand:- start:166 stop:435 length:270 start_codon:yes stop_codon:yes gene_type:complete
MATKTERVEARFLPEIKALAERAASVSGVTLTEYLASLVREDAPKTLKSHTEIQLTNQQFDNFLAICEAEQEPSKAILDAAKRLDEEGF